MHYRSGKQYLIWFHWVLLYIRKLWLDFRCRNDSIKSSAMARTKITAIKNWIKEMGFELIKSHVIKGRSTKINYYSLGSFGIYEEISKTIKGGKKVAGEKLRFISWTPWGVDFEVNSVNDLSKAYQDSISYNPDVVLS